MAVREGTEGWHRDPGGGRFERWWDGHRWTEFTRALPPMPLWWVWMLFVAMLGLLMFAYAIWHVDTSGKCPCY